jgi:NADH-quinone oxidoreductase subunit C
VPVEEAVVSTDATCQQMLDQLRSAFGDRILGADINREDVTIRVPVADWVEVASFAKNKLALTYFCFLNGLDWLNNPVQTTRYENVWGSVEEETAAEEGAESADAAEPAGETADAVADDVVAEEEAAFRTGRAGGDTRFQVFARYFSVDTRRGLIVKADLDESDPRVPTITKVYAGADWHERETWEMYGFWIDGHPHLVHLYLPGGFEGYPMRKDFPLLAREVKPWPGLTNVEPIAGSADEEEGA